MTVSTEAVEGRRRSVRRAGRHESTAELPGRVPEVGRVLLASTGHRLRGTESGRCRSCTESVQGRVRGRGRNPALWQASLYRREAVDWL